MRCKPPKYRPLIVCAQVEETVPCQKALEASAELQLLHVRDKPLGIRKTSTAEFNHGWRSIHANDAKPAIEEVASDRLASRAAQIENRPSGRYMDQKPIQSRALLKRPAAVAIVLAGMTLI
jgi:hypothetical protein